METNYGNQQKLTELQKHRSSRSREMATKLTLKLIIKSPHTLLMQCAASRPKQGWPELPGAIVWLVALATLVRAVDSAPLPSYSDMTRNKSGAQPPIPCAARWSRLDAS